MRRDRAGEEQSEHEHRDVRRLLGREAHGEQAEERDRLPACWPIEETDQHDDEAERDTGRVDVLAREAREVEVARAEAEERGRGDGGGATELPAQEEREEHDRGAHQDRRDPSDGVAGAEEEVEERDQIELHRPVEDRVVVVAVSADEVPREPGVLALVVVEWFAGEVDGA